MEDEGEVGHGGAGVLRGGETLGGAQGRQCAAEVQRVSLLKQSNW